VLVGTHVRSLCPTGTKLEADLGEGGGGGAWVNLFPFGRPAPFKSVVADFSCFSPQRTPRFFCCCFSWAIVFQASLLFIAVGAAAPVSARGRQRTFSASRFPKNPSLGSPRCLRPSALLRARWRLVFLFGKSDGLLWFPCRLRKNCIGHWRDFSSALG